MKKFKVSYQMWTSDKENRKRVYDPVYPGLGHSHGPKLDYGTVVEGEYRKCKGCWIGYGTGEPEPTETCEGMIVVRKNGRNWSYCSAFFEEVKNNNLTGQRPKEK